MTTVFFADPIMHGSLVDFAASAETGALFSDLKVSFQNQRAARITV
jgi:hypothetical protein